MFNFVKDDFDESMEDIMKSIDKLLNEKLEEDRDIKKEEE